ncbi:MAG TPA: transcription-repair coupling factor [Microbacteriaceae bacterium]|nr:transcription-repair coupling factor [Microbacteriaceae bacterium]
MSLSGLPKLLQSSSGFVRAVEGAESDLNISVLEGLRAPVIVGQIEQSWSSGDRGVHLIVTATSREADRLRREIETMIPDARTAELSAWETLPHERLSPSTETLGRRQRVLSLIRGDDNAVPRIVFASVRAVLQPISQHAAAGSHIDLFEGKDDVGFDELVQTLIDFAYMRVDMVTRRGEFAVRGGMVDVFAPTEDHAVRIDFFGDEIEQMRAFAVSDQRSAGEALESLRVGIARELLLTEEVRAKAIELQPKMPAFSSMLEQLGQGILVEGMEALLPALDGKLALVTELMPKGGSVTVVSPERVATRALSLHETNREFLDAAWEQAGGGGAAPIQVSGDGLATLSEVRSVSVSRPWRTVTAFSSSPEESADEVFVEGGPLPVPSAGEIASDFFADKSREWITSGIRVVLVCQSSSLANRAAENLLEHGLPVEQVSDLQNLSQKPIVYVVSGTAWSGFYSQDAKLALITETEFFGRSFAERQNAPQKLARRSKQVVDPLKLVAGDYVVHETHGIGQFVELVSRMVPTGSGRNAQKAQREYLVLEYAPNKRGLPKDKLFVPTDQLDQLSRYVGGESPSLSKMGGSDWSTAKKKARKAVRDIAVELVKLYAARMSVKGHPFSPDTPWQYELEESFPHVETVDQLTTIAEVKADMEKPQPMDRLISGDVGFGKTEIAVRAAFKAVQDNKQVAILVPTTLLVKQHMETFQDRFAGFPVRLHALSRFQTEKEARATIEGLAAGTVDVVIGTHRLLSPNVQYKDLGLLVIDEEQRFGVEHKDAIKKLKTGVDILAMSATPIPRTLEMAVTGIREMSTLATAPEDRHPILTFVGQRSDSQMAAAVRREMLREGQIFVVHNRVQSINKVAAKIAELVPDARVAVAHGKLSEAQLEQVVIDFWERKYDVLVATTIIETGLDIANANTIIIDQADRYGLSQLHQLRGRVGRSRERAYAYFLYDPEKPLTETAHERLETIARNNELGSGMQVALKDLELRGAGNLLGGEQSGHIAGVGFDLYLRMISEAVNTFKGEETQEQKELVLELAVDAHIPEEYIDSERLRLEAYQKFAAASHPQAPEEHVQLVLEELRDRYGDEPEEVIRLAEVTKLRRRAAKLGLTKVVAGGSMLRISPVELADSRRMRLSRMYPKARYSAELKSLQIPLPEKEGLLTRRSDSVTEDTLTWVAQIFSAILEEDKTNEL